MTSALSPSRSALWGWAGWALHKRIEGLRSILHSTPTPCILTLDYNPIPHPNQEGASPDLHKDALWLMGALIGWKEWKGMCWRGPEL